MTPNEFAEGFIPEFRACLPQLAKSLKEQPEYKETLKRWRDERGKDKVRSALAPASGR